LTATLTTALLSTVGLSASADHHENALPLTGYFSFSTENAPAVVAAVRAFAASECREAMPTNMVLMGNLFNGDNPATHTMIWGNASVADLSASFAAFGECRAAATLGSTLAELTKPVSQSLGTPLIAEGDPAQGNVYTVWSVRVMDEAAYAAAYQRLMAAQAEAGMVNGPYGVVRIVAGRPGGATHFVYSGSPSLDAHFAGPGPGAAFMEFNEAVKDIRAVVSQDLAFRVAAF
jgi:hypothetical protein